MLHVRYASQRVAAPFFVSAMVFFLLQLLYGLTLALQQVDPLLLQGFLNFNVARASHLNLGVVWIVTGVAGTLLFAGPLLAGRDIRYPWVARALLGAIWAIVLWTAATLPLAQRGIAGWAFGQPWLQEGLEYLEAGRVSDILLLVGFGSLAYLLVSMFPRPAQWNEIHWALAIGLGGLATLWVFGMFFVPAIDLQEYFRWYVVHYWVEGVWEILHIAIVGFLLYVLFDADLRVIRFAVFWGVVFVVLTGLIGNAHHYFWIGTPTFWQFWGSLFSALEPLPMLLALWHVFLDTSRGRKPLANKAAFYFIFGSVLLEQVGAGILGVTQTFALTNLWEHGTWVSPAHAHLALFGTFGMLVIGGAYWAIPAVRGIDRFDERLAKTGFWLLLTALLGMTVSFALGGTVQIYIYRVLGLDWFGGEVRPALALSRAALMVFGLLFTTGAGVVIYDLFTLGHRARAEEAATAVRLAAPSRWGQPIGGLEMGGWVGALWFFGFLITGGLLSFNLPSARLGDPSLPYMLAAVGYPALALVTLLFAVRFLRALEIRQLAPAPNDGPLAQEHIAAIE